MFGGIRKRVSYTNVVLTLILVFAMSGGAYAAGRYLITSTKQISPKVLKALAGKSGATGPAGAAGAGRSSRTHRLERRIRRWTSRKRRPSRPDWPSRTGWSGGTNRPTGTNRLHSHTPVQSNRDGNMERLRSTYRRDSSCNIYFDFVRDTFEDGTR